MKKYLLLALLPLLYACSDSPTHRRGINYDEVFSKDTQGLDILTGQFSHNICLLYTSPSPRDTRQSRMPSSA